MKLDDFDPLEKIALLAPHAIDLRHIPSDFRRLTAADIAAKLTKVSKGASMLGRYKIAGDETALKGLVFLLQVQITETVIKEGMNKQYPIIQLFSKLAITEVVNPKVCRWCKGIGWFPEMDETGKPTGKPHTCEACTNGRKPYTERSRAKACNIHPEDWRRRYSRIYIEVLTIPLTWESELRQEFSC